MLCFLKNFDETKESANFETFGGALSDLVFYSIWNNFNPLYLKMICVNFG
jgi:hypothetical protein